jgi:hypothetical protein
MMGKLVMAAIGCLMLAAAPLAMGQGQSTPPKKEGTTAQKKQQERQNACNARANDQGLTNTARKNFVAACLKGNAAVGAQQQGQNR